MLTIRTRFLLAFACAVAPFASNAGSVDAGAGASLRAEEAESNQTLVAALLRPDLRDRAICELLRRQKYQHATDPTFAHCWVNSVVVAPQGTEPPIFVVFLTEDLSDYAGLEGPRGRFVLVDSDGSLLPAFWNANVLDARGDIIRYRGDERIALALMMPVDGGSTSGGLQALHIVPVERRPRSLLSVIVGPSGHTVETTVLVRDDLCHGDTCMGATINKHVTKTVYPWSWRQVTLPAAAPVIEIGPAKALGHGKPAATFRWSPGLRSYEGPRGGRAQGFLRFDGRIETWPDAVFSFTGRRPR